MTESAAMDCKPRFPRAQALEVAREIVRYLKPVSERLIVAGSLRRRKHTVGDVEILFIPKLKEMPRLKQADFLTPPEREQFDLAEGMIWALAGYYREVQDSGEMRATFKDEGEVRRAKDYILTPRRTSTGSWTWGPKNKLARHVASGIPVDFFTATEANWFNYLVCRTGGAENNKQIAMEAQRKGWKWNPYGAGFTDQEGNVVPVKSEEDVFRLVGMKYLEPWDRS